MAVNIIPRRPSDATPKPDWGQVQQIEGFIDALHPGNVVHYGRIWINRIIDQVGVEDFFDAPDAAAPNLGANREAIRDRIRVIFQRNMAWQCQCCGGFGHPVQKCPTKFTLDAKMAAEGYKYAWGVVKGFGWYSRYLSGVSADTHGDRIADIATRAARPAKRRYGKNGFKRRNGY